MSKLMQQNRFPLNINSSIDNIQKVVQFLGYIQST